MQARYIKEIEEYRVLSKENFEYYPHFHVQMEILFLERGKEEVVIDGRLFQMEGATFALVFRIRCMIIGWWKKIWLTC